jgi:hypothetical protein
LAVLAMAVTRSDLGLGHLSREARILLLGFFIVDEQKQINIEVVSLQPCDTIIHRHMHWVVNSKLPWTWNPSTGPGDKSETHILLVILQTINKTCKLTGRCKPPIFASRTQQRKIESARRVSQCQKKQVTPAPPTPQEKPERFFSKREVVDLYTL